MKEKYHIVPRNTYNLEEKGFILGVGQPVKRICRNARTSATYKEHRVRKSCTVVETICTDSFTLTPLIIFHGEHQLAGWHKTEKEMVFWYGQEPKGFSNNVICMKYFEKIFHPETEAQ